MSNYHATYVVLALVGIGCAYWLVRLGLARSERRSHLVALREEKQSEVPLSIPGVTNPDQAWRLGRLLVAQTAKSMPTEHQNKPGNNCGVKLCRGYGS
jgi:hypothetical protein